MFYETFTTHTKKNLKNPNMLEEHPSPKETLTEHLPPSRAQVPPLFLAQLLGSSCASTFLDTLSSAHSPASSHLPAVLSQSPLLDPSLYSRLFSLPSLTQFPQISSHTCHSQIDICSTDLSTESQTHKSTALVVGNPKNRKQVRTKMAKDQCGKILISRGGADPEARRGARSQGAAVSSWGWEVELTENRKADGTSFQNCQDAFQLMNKKRSHHRFQHHGNREEKD